MGLGSLNRFNPCSVDRNSEDRHANVSLFPFGQFPFPWRTSFANVGRSNNEFALNQATIRWLRPRLARHHAAKYPFSTLTGLLRLSLMGYLL